MTATASERRARRLLILLLATQALLLAQIVLVHQISKQRDAAIAALAVAIQQAAPDADDPSFMLVPPCSNPSLPGGTGTAL